MQLLPVMRFCHMSRDFLGAVVSACPYANAPDMLLPIMRRSHARHKILKDSGMADSTYTFKSQLELAGLLHMEKKKSELHKHVGLAWGFPVSVIVEHVEQGTLGLYVDVDFLLGQVLEFEGEDGRYAGFTFSIKAGEETFECEHFFDGKSSWGENDFFKKSWDEVVYPNSPYFPDDMLAVEPTITPITWEEEEEEEEEEKEEEEVKEED